MILEHEIPSGSKLYFGKSAKLKRDIENSSAKILEELGFIEISTPLFSYHQDETFIDSNILVRVNDTKNNSVSLRADSTVDVVRIATNRLARSENVKKWFYIQPIFSFPTNEQHQIAAEILNGELSEVADIALKLLKNINIEFTFQIANMAISNLLTENYGISIEDIKSIRLDKLLKYNLTWIEALVSITNIEDLEDLSIYPEDIASELSKMRELAKKIDSKNCILSPLYYAPMHYYNSLIFRAFSAQSLYATGGVYNIKGVSGAGFAIYTDAIIAKKMQKGIDE